MDQHHPTARSQPKNDLRQPQRPTTITTMDQQTYSSNDSPQHWPTSTHHHEPTHLNDVSTNPHARVKRRMALGAFGSIEREKREVLEWKEKKKGDIYIYFFNERRERQVCLIFLTISSLIKLSFCCFYFFSILRVFALGMLNGICRKILTFSHKNQVSFGLLKYNYCKKICNSATVQFYL